MFLDVLAELCSHIPEAERKVGRPRAAMPEMVFSCVSKVYEQLSSRRATSDLEIARGKGYLSHTPHFNTVLKYFNDPLLTPILTDLIQLSALPLRDLEDSFAVDASGLSTAFYSRWFDYRFAKRGQHGWLKIHLICGVKSNIVTHIIVTDGHSNDSPHFPELVRKTAEHFRVREVYADKGYASRQNVGLVADLGGEAFIPPKKGTTAKMYHETAWRKLYHFFQLHREEFYAHYHKRSNVESTFSMLKRKFQGRLMLKNEVAQTNEALAKVLCHNITVLVREAIEGNAVLGFQELAHLFPNLHTNPQPIINPA